MTGPAPWAYGGAPRVLVEDADYDEGLRLTAALRRAGYNVALCLGPHTDPDHRCACPLVDHDECAVVDGADVVVSALGLSGPEQRAVVETLRLRRGSKPVVLLVSPSDLGWLPELGEQCKALVRPLEPEDVAGVVAETLASLSAARVRRAS